MSDQALTARKSWCWLSTHESIANEVPSVTAILETIIAVPLYWWVALGVGVVLPLLISAAVAPLVLLRSDQSVALGVKLFKKLNLSRQPVNFPTQTAAAKSLAPYALIAGVFLLVLYPFTSSVTLPSGGTILVFQGSETISLDIIFSVSFIICSVVFVCVTILAVGPAASGIASGLGILIICFVVRILATLRFLPEGVLCLPRNFRRLTLCTSPAQAPELIPGLEATIPAMSFSNFMYQIVLSSDMFGRITSGLLTFIIFSPAWLYRITIKSTSWFWWPLAFLGGDLKRAKNPKLFHWEVMGSLWAKTSIVLAIASLVAFAIVNLVFDGTMFQRNPLLTPLGYLLLIDWKLRSWQVCALVGAALSIALVYLVDYVSGQYRIAQETDDGKLLAAANSKFGWIERLARVRFLLLLAFWALVGTHMVLFVNSTQCWFSLSPKLQEWAQDIYGDRLPRSNECPLPR